MCGRYTLTTPGEVIAEIFDLSEEPEVAARYNVAPTQEVAAIRAPSEESESGERRFATLRWGLVPHWADDPSIGNRMINARAESVADKPAFRASFKKKRCLVLADGFYEWQKLAGGKKQPWYFRLESGEPFAFAGLWASWNRGEPDADRAPLETCALLTTDANALVKKAHHRMPVMLAPEDLDLWLDPKVTDREPLEKILRPFDPAKMIAFPVSTRVNSPANDDPSVIEPLGDAERAGADEPDEEQQALF